MGGPAEAAPLGTEGGAAAITQEEFKGAVHEIAMRGDALELIYLWQNAPQEHRHSIEEGLASCVAKAPDINCATAIFLGEIPVREGGTRLLPVYIRVEAAARDARRGVMGAAAKMLIAGPTDYDMVSRLEKALHEGILHCKRPDVRRIDFLAELMEVQGLPQSIFNEARHSFGRVLKMIPYRVRDGRIDWKERFHDHLAEIRLEEVLSRKLPESAVAEALMVCGEVGKLNSVYEFSRKEGLSPCLANASRNAVIGALAVYGKEGQPAPLAEFLKKGGLSEEEEKNAEWALRDALRRCIGWGACVRIAQLFDKGLVPAGKEDYVGRALCESMDACRKGIHENGNGARFALQSMNSIEKMKVPESAKKTAGEIASMAKRKEGEAGEVFDKARGFLRCPMRERPKIEPNREIRGERMRRRSDLDWDTPRGG